MLRNFILPALVVGALSYGVIGYGGYSLLKPTTEAQFEMESALAGDIPAQKHAAGCYSNGHCAGLVQAPVIGCAWRRIIADETGHDAVAEREAEEACRVIGPDLSRTVMDAKREIEARMAQVKLKPHTARKG